MPHQAVRWIEMALERRAAERDFAEEFRIGIDRPLRVFSMDLHFAGPEDVANAAREHRAEITRWSISGHNHLLSGWRPAPDPVAHINHKTWVRWWRNWDPRALTDDQIASFQERYAGFLKTFDAFLVTHTPAFAQIYEPFGKQTLVIASTRYEAPYTKDKFKWERLNDFLLGGVENDSIRLLANNAGDADYLDHYTGYVPEVFPYLSEGDGGEWIGGSGRRVIIGRDHELARAISRISRGVFEPVQALGTPYPPGALLRCEEVFVLPQNISTATLFELATAGVPVAVPDPSWVKELVAAGSEVLGELTYAQIAGFHLGYDRGGPCDWESPGYYDWWLKRADFLNESLMPNVRTVGSVAELAAGSPRSADRSFRASVDERNSFVRGERRRLLGSFFEKLR